MHAPRPLRQLLVRASARLQQLAHRLDRLRVHLYGAVLLVCDECGGIDIEVLEWVDANFDEVIGVNDDPPSSHKWCRTCEENAHFDTRTFAPKEFR